MGDSTLIIERLNHVHCDCIHHIVTFVVEQVVAYLPWPALT